MGGGLRQVRGRHRVRAVSTVQQPGLDMLLLVCATDCCILLQTHRCFLQTPANLTCVPPAHLQAFLLSGRHAPPPDRM